jgi:Fe-S-cluster-containing hydrogenase component 2
VTACPKSALSQDEETGVIVVDENLCVGCDWCISACDFGAIMIHPEKKVVFICNNCKDQPDGPQCVKWCPEEALDFVSSDVLAQKSRISAVKNLFKEAPKEPEK